MSNNYSKKDCDINRPIKSSYSSLMIRDRKKRFRKLDPEHAFSSRLRFSPPWDYKWTKDGGAWRRCIQRAHNSKQFTKTLFTILHRKNNNSNKIYTYTLCSMIASNKNVTVITSIALNKTLTGFQMIQCSLATLDMSHHEIIKYS